MEDVYKINQDRQTPSEWTGRPYYSIPTRMHLQQLTTKTAKPRKLKLQTSRPGPWPLPQWSDRRWCRLHETSTVGWVASRYRSSQHHLPKPLPDVCWCWSLASHEECLDGNAVGLRPSIRGTRGQCCTVLDLARLARLGALVIGEKPRKLWKLHRR